MFGWIKRKAQIKFLKLMDEDIERFIAGVRGANASEVGMIVAQATNKRHFLAGKGIDLLRPTKAEREDIFLAQQLGRLIREAQERDPSDAPGWMVWLHTIRAANTPELRFKGRILWKELARGFPHVDDAADDFLELTGVAWNVEGYATVPEGLEDDGR